MTFPHTAIIRRQTEVGLKTVFANSGSTVCFLQPLDTESSIAYGITFAKSAACYLPSTSGVMEGDELVINGTTYGVRGIRTHAYGSLAHSKAILEQV